MSNLHEKSLITLELNRVLELLAEHAVSEEAKEKCRDLRPVTEPDRVRLLQNETSAACMLMTVKGSPGFQGVRQVGPALLRADMGGVLNTFELLGIAAVLRAARTVKAYGEGEQKTCLDGLFSAIQANRYLEEKITNSIIGEDELADSASPELADIRRHMRMMNAKAREALQKIISSPAYSKYLQEPIITIRSDRYVVPVKSEHKNDIPGLVHDVSSSGGTFFVEPMQALQANNELREWAAKEKKEIQRILAELSAEAAEHKDAIMEDYDILIRLDTIFARAHLSYDMKAIEPQITDSGKLELKRARHPLIDKKDAVPITVYLGGEFDTLVITGPNTGGKTVTLKTIGLLTLMAECGLHIPANDGSYISVFDRILADIGDEQSIEQSLSTFSSHMTNIIEILKDADGATLILFDELGAGTDPVEGAALAVSIIEYARSLGAKIAATTHYAEMKVYAMRTDGVQNASCEFDVQTLKPTYRLLIGVPGKSNAFAISKRLGLSEAIIEKSKGLVDEENTNFEDILLQLEQQRQAMEEARLEAQKLKLETEESNKKAAEYRSAIEREREKAVQLARMEAQKIIDEARETANTVFAELSEMRKKQKKSENWQQANEDRASLFRTLNEAEAALGQKQERVLPPPTREIRKGDTVELLNLGTKATVIAIENDGSLQLQAGIMKIKAKPEEVHLLENEVQPELKKYMDRSAKKLKTLAASPEIDLRGMMVEEALGALDIFLDNAVMANLPSVTVIHGKGTGALRKAIQTHLRSNRYVKEHRLGRYGEGEDGVTIITLKT